MADFTPSFNLYASDGVTLVYAFEYITPPIIGWPSDNPSSIGYNNTRASGSITIPEGEKSYNIVLNGILLADNYTTLTTQIFALRDTIVANTRYVLKCEKSSGIYDSIKVMRLDKIDLNPSKRVRIQKYKITLRALSWS